MHERPAHLQHSTAITIYYPARCYIYQVVLLLRSQLNFIRYDLASVSLLWPQRSISVVETMPVVNKAAVEGTA